MSTNISQLTLWFPETERMRVVAPPIPEAGNLVNYKGSVSFEETKLHYPTVSELLDSDLAEFLVRTSTVQFPNGVRMVRNLKEVLK